MSGGPVLVTGAAGFAGQHVLRALLDAGRPVRGWVHRSPLPAELAAVPVDTVDIRDPAACARAIAAARPSGVIHLAAVTSVGAAEADPEAAHRVNVLGTRNVLAPLPDALPSVLASTCHVYGASAALPIDERAPLRPIGVYARTKVGAEAAAQAVHPATVLARAFHHTGPGQAPTFALAQWARDLAEGVRPVRTGDLGLRRDYCDVRDIARGYLHLLDHAQPGAVVNLCSGRAPSLGALLQLMAGAAPVEAAPNPAWFREHDPPEIRGDPSRAAALGWHPRIPLARTLEDLRLGFSPRGCP